MSPTGTLMRSLSAAALLFLAVALAASRRAR